MVAAWRDGLVGRKEGVGGELESSESSAFSSGGSFSFLAVSRPTFLHCGGFGVNEL